MRTVPWIGLAIAVLSGCVATPEPAGTQGTPATAARPGTAAQANVVPPPPSAGSPLLAAVGTPFLIAFKIPVCVVTAVVAGPIAALTMLAGPSSADGAAMRSELADGLAQNCGPPYVLSP